MNNNNKDEESNLFQKEQEILKFWQKSKIFEKSVDKKHPQGEYSFYDGPPFATGLPHYGHIVASLLKDVFPRYKTMRGYKVTRKWGWDCHGLPIESLVEKDLGIKDKVDIENKIGIDKFNEACRQKVMKYADEWKKFIPMIGRWVDMEDDYKTMDLEYMESIWWVFKQLWDKDLIYEGYKSMHICPHCETTLSNFEVSQAYKDIDDLSVIAKFELASEPNTYLLAWTTTPWTLPGNVALAIGGGVDYVKVLADNKNYILAKANLEIIFKDTEYKIINKIEAKDLINKKYKPLFDFSNHDLEHKENLYTIQSADFVTIEDGTGIVHIAPAFGDDDMNLGQTKNLPFIQHVDLSGHFTKVMVNFGDFVGLEVKPKQDTQETDKKVIKYLKEKDLAFKVEEYEHSYPHCWRCDAPLLNYATSSWFVNVSKIKDKIVKNNQEINWVPENFQEGRMGKWLEGARDWSISRQRYWGSVLPIWKCECGEIKVMGSIQDLEKISEQKINDLHKHNVDKITFKCPKCKKEMTRIPDVFDCWFESGSMPYASIHYPFDPSSLSSQSSDNYGARNKDSKIALPKGFPCNFVAEGQDQTRGWFYTLLVLSTALFNKPAFKNVVVNGIVLAEDGQKMSKRLQNYPDPTELIKKYSADVLRYYLLSSSVVKAGDLCFLEKDVATIYSRYFLTLLNVLSFYKMYQQDSDLELGKIENLLDSWVLIKLKEFKKEISNNLENYELKKCLDLIGSFILELSTWYLRRSRDRFKSADKNAGQTLYYLLLEFSKIIAPFLPFMAEYIYQELKGSSESVHLLAWPELKNLEPREMELLNNMKKVREIVEKIHNLRSELGLKVRQPLALAKYHFGTTKLDEQLEKIIIEEVNVKKIEFFKRLKDQEVDLDTKLTPELKQEGNLRELIRNINALRKKAKLTIEDKIEVYFQTENQELIDLIKNNEEELKNSVLAQNFNNEKIEDGLIEKEFQVNEYKIMTNLKKV